MAGPNAETSAPHSPPSSPSVDDDTLLSIKITHHGQPHTFSFPPTATLADLSTSIHTTLAIPPPTQKFLITPQTGLLKPPFATPPPLRTLLSKKILLLAPTPSHLLSISNPTPRLPPPLKPARPSPRRPDQQTLHAETTYTFHTLLPLAHLPHPSRSLHYLERLRADPGIKSAMRTHRLAVGVLTEMNPAQHTTHDSRTLGLNRNKGEVIELRLRTDAGDGYRAYAVIRDTLCHELAHNVHGPHDRDFWELCKRIEGDVRRGDWKSGGERVGEGVFYEPEDGGGVGNVDGGGWSGGEYVLGGGGEGGSGLGRREAMAKAAEERMKREREGEGG